MAQSGLVIVIEEAERRIGHLRRRFDPQASLGVPAHVTLLFPFMPPDEVDESVVSRLAGVFAAIAPFSCRFANVRRFPSTAWLAPDNPEPFVCLTQVICTVFPAYPPYGGEHAGIIPHLTVADGDAAAAEEAERALMDAGPIEARCTAVTLLENTSGRWLPMHTFPLGAS